MHEINQLKCLLHILFYNSPRLMYADDQEAASDAETSASLTLFLSLYFIFIPSLFVLVAFYIISTVRRLRVWPVEEEDITLQGEEEGEPSSATVSIDFHFDIIIMD